MFQDWQEITNSIFCGGPAGAETANGCLVLILGTTAERHERELKTVRVLFRASPKRAGRAFALLTRTYHGSRVSGNWLMPRYY
jgi:hypothetical protein